MNESAQIFFLAAPVGTAVSNSNMIESQRMGEGQTSPVSGSGQVGER
jgi:hypothetical protein